MGIAKYNAECRSIVMRYSHEWRAIVERMGRWIDFDNDYKTLNPSFMESVWWGIKELASPERNLLYRGVKVMPYSTGCCTPLSNFEAKQVYQDVHDPAIVISFPIIGDELKGEFLAWTTTPWTLPSNLALCVHPDFEYVYVKDEARDDRVFVMCKSRLCMLYPKPKKGKKVTKLPYTILKTVKGSDLKGLKYVPLYDYFCEFASKHGCHSVVCDTYVTDDSGTGIVHVAPFFGEDDYRVCHSNKLIIPGGDVVCPLDPKGCFTPEVTDFAGMYVKDADAPIMADLKERGRLLKKEMYKHSYPFCYRSDTPLLYRAIPSWFVRVTEIKEQLIANNLKSKWVPAFVQEKRFHNWLKDARDWAISRNRFWGTPLPIWESPEDGYYIVIGSIAELEEKAELEKGSVTDIHRDKIDHITIADPRGPKEDGTERPALKRVPYVADCWLESGSMPFAQKHYPFECKEEFEKGGSADFIAEGLDQTRGWFYTLLVMSTALFGRHPAHNVIVNGLILAADGKKMSKRLKNYPDPSEIMSRIGADPLRLFLTNSPAVHAEPLSFKETGVREVVRDVLLPWFNAYRFLVQNVTMYESKHGKAFEPRLMFGEKKEEEKALEDEGIVTSCPVFVPKRHSVMDSWIVAELGQLVQFVLDEMKMYHLHTVLPVLVQFINSLTNWYVRLNRNRLKGIKSDVSFGTPECEKKLVVDDQFEALETLYYVLFQLVRLMSPYTPFFAESVYSNLVRCLPKDSPLSAESVHFLDIPRSPVTTPDQKLLSLIHSMQKAIELGRCVRDKVGIGLKTPLSKVVVVHPDAEVLDECLRMKELIKKELFVFDLEVSSEISKFALIQLTPNYAVLGKKFGREMKKIMAELKKVPAEDILVFRKTGRITIGEYNLTDEELSVEVSPRSLAGMETHTDGTMIVALHTDVTDELRDIGALRHFVGKVQQLRKEANLEPSQSVVVCVSGKDVGFVQKNEQSIAQQMRRGILEFGVGVGEELIKDEVAFGPYTVSVVLKG
eukprot:gnl/Carplike_NY0171/1800_a2436_689.p1 GENE.gnl/Carplike_NY0171/1800_a2436_689~~gnl/Carplike_NY0171/1800_a2436_689.p1  ORF type:complete len:1133 (-),score=411.08 gnl/Carplike_NY0171/1800_a2436_689:88-3111(-)